MLQEDLRQLLDLQEVDETIAEARREQRRLPEVVAAENEAYHQADDLLTAAQAQLAAYEKEQRSLESELVDQEAHLARIKERLKEVSNTREYQANIQEMDGVQRQIGTLEERILEILTLTDTNKQELDELKKSHQEHKQVYEAERAKVDVQLDALQKQVEAQEALKAERASAVDKVLLRRYERICRTVRRALVAIQGDSCTGCNMRVPPQLVSEVKRGQKIHDCPHCHRLLFVAAALDTVPAEHSGTA